MIDPHVHLRDWNQKEKETVAHGLSEAKRHGFTHVFDMPNTDPPLVDRQTVEKRFLLAEGIDGIGYHVWMGLTPDPAQIAEAVSAYYALRPKVVGLKMFLGHSTGNMGICDYDTQLSVFRELTARRYDGTVAVHAEKESLMRPELFVPGAFETHSLARPPESEIASVRDALNIIRETGFAGTLHIAHISTAGAVALVKQAQSEGLRVRFGVTPHHALFTSEDAKDHSRFLKMNPPLRSESDRAAVYATLFDGSAAWIESDHAPHTLAQKEAGASGIPGFDNMLLLIDRLKRDGMNEKRLRELTYGNAAKLLET